MARSLPWGVAIDDAMPVRGEDDRCRNFEKQTRLELHSTLPYSEMLSPSVPMWNMSPLPSSGNQPDRPQQRTGSIGPHEPKAERMTAQGSTVYTCMVHASAQGPSVRVAQDDVVVHGVVQVEEVHEEVSRVVYGRVVSCRVVSIMR